MYVPGVRMIATDLDGTLLRETRRSSMNVLGESLRRWPKDPMRMQRLADDARLAWWEDRRRGDYTPLPGRRTNECCAPACEVLPMQSTIVVPLDGSLLAEHAVPYAERLDSATSARLILCRALSASKLEPTEIVGAVDEAHAYMQGVADQLTSRGRMVETTI